MEAEAIGVEAEAVKKNRFHIPGYEHQQGTHAPMFFGMYDRYYKKMLACRNVVLIYLIDLGRDGICINEEKNIHSQFGIAMKKSSTMLYDQQKRFCGGW